MADFLGAPLYGSTAWPFASTPAPTVDEPLDTIPGREVLDVGYSPPTAGRLELAGIAQASTRAIDAGFTYEVVHADPAATGDALNPAIYTFSAPVALPLVQYVEHVGPGVVRVFFDADLPTGVIVELVVSALLEAAEPTVTTGPILTASLVLPTYGAGTTARLTREVAARRDLRNPQSVREGSVDVPGTLALDARGDYANEDGDAYFRKRVLRRASTVRNGFALLPGYGFAPRIKGLVRPSDLAALRREIERQVLEEPDATSARASVTVIGPGVVLARISATHSSGVVITGETTIEIGS